MSGTKRVIFIKLSALVVEAAPTSYQGAALSARPRPMLIPALLRLQDAGHTLIVDLDRGDASSLDILELLKSQGVNLLKAEANGATTAAGARPNIYLYRELLGGAALDLEQSAVIGQTEVDQTFAANLGVKSYGLGADEIAWPTLVDTLIKRPRRAKVKRRTAETDIVVSVNLDGDAKAASVATGIGFFDHMLAQLSRHSGIEMQIAVTGDLHIDEHHTVEDTALALGEALQRALGDRFGIERYGCVMPMDESLVTAALDLSGRPMLVWSAAFGRSEVGGLATEMVPHFFSSFTEKLGATLHVDVRGENAHHMVEGAFKAVAKCLGQAVRRGAQSGVPSTKGVL